MRMWMVEPAIMCTKHLLGEHVELHMFVGSINRGMNLAGYIKNNLLEAKSIMSRHELLVMEMTKRGFKHQSPLPAITNNIIQSNEIDKEKSLADLLNRCARCKARIS